MGGACATSSPRSRTPPKTYLPNGRAPQAGEVFKNPDLAASLRLIADKGRGRLLRRQDRRRDPGDLEREQGRHDDRRRPEGFQPEWVEPISTTYRGWTVYELPPNTQGIAALMMLNMMEQFPLGEYGFHSANAMHVMIEAKKLAYADMLRYVARPAVLARCRSLPMLDKAQAQGARGADRSGEGRVRACEPSHVRRPDRRVRAATRSTSRSSIATATSCR